MKNVLATDGTGTSFTPCPAGTYDNGSVICTNCPTGKYSSTGSTACTSCSKGYSTPGIGQAGTSSAITHSPTLNTFTNSVSACMICAPGYYIPLQRYKQYESNYTVTNGALRYGMTYNTAFRDGNGCTPISPGSYGVDITGTSVNLRSNTGGGLWYTVTPSAMSSINPTANPTTS